MSQRSTLALRGCLPAQKESFSQTMSLNVLRGGRFPAPTPSIPLVICAAPDKPPGLIALCSYASGRIRTIIPNYPFNFPNRKEHFGLIGWGDYNPSGVERPPIQSPPASRWVSPPNSIMERLIKYESYPVLEAPPP